MTTSDALQLVGVLLAVLAILAMLMPSQRRMLGALLAFVVIAGTVLVIWRANATPPAAAAPQPAPVKAEVLPQVPQKPVATPPATATETVAATVTLTDPAPAPQPSRPPKPVDKVFLSGLEFGRPSCTQRADRVRCVFRVTNHLEKSQKLELEMTNISRSSWFSYLVDGEGTKYFPVDADVGGVPQRLWGSEQLDPGVPIQASVTFESAKPLSAPLAISVSVRIQAADALQIGAPQTVFFKDLELQ
jgi:hypothetical protein